MFNSTFARLGEYDTRSFSDGKHEDINIAQKITHEKWNLNLMINDIAILKLEKDTPFNGKRITNEIFQGTSNNFCASFLYLERISPICLPDNGAILTKSFVGQTPFVAGWGRQAESSQLSNILQQVQVPVISNAQCKKMYEDLGRVKDDIQFSDIVLCAGFTAGGKDSCQGDSGGPMMLPESRNGKFPYFQIGVVSWGIGCARPNIPGFYLKYF